MARKLEVVITGDSRGLERAYDRAGKATSSFGSKLGQLAKGAAVGAAVAGTYALAKGLTSSVKAAMDAEKVMASLQAQMKASGLSFDENSAKIDAQVTALSRMSGLDDEDLTSGLTKLIRVTGDTDKALSRMGLVADLARARNIDVSKSADIVGKVMAGNIGILSRYGVVVEKGSTVTEALGAAQQKVGGQAEAYGNATAGAHDKVRVAIENVQESIGKKLLPEYNKMLNWAATQLPKINTLFDQHGDSINRVFNRIGTFIQMNLQPRFEIFKAVAMAAWKGVSKVIEDNGPALERIFSRVAKAVEVVSTVMLFMAQKVVIPVLKPILGTVLPAILGVVIGVLDKTSFAVEKIITAFKWIGEKTAGLWKAASKGIAGPAGAIAASLQPVFAVLNSIRSAMDYIIGHIGGLLDAIGKIPTHIPDLNPFRAAGGPVTAGGSYIVGEEGPEWFVPKQSGTIIPNGAGGSGGRALSGGSTVINVSFPNYVGSHNELIDTVRRGLADVARRNPGALPGVA